MPWKPCVTTALRSASLVARGREPFISSSSSCGNRTVSAKAFARRCQARSSWGRVRSMDSALGNDERIDGDNLGAADERIDVDFGDLPGQFRRHHGERCHHHGEFREIYLGAAAITIEQLAQGKPIQ